MNHLKKTTIQGAREKFNMSLYISTKEYTPVNISTKGYTPVNISTKEYTPVKIRIIEISNTENWICSRCLVI